MCGFWKVWVMPSGKYSVSFKPPFQWAHPLRITSSLALCVSVCTLLPHKSKIFPFNKFTEPHKNLWEYLVLHANIYQVKMDTFPQLLVLGFFCGETANCTCMLVWHQDKMFPWEENETTNSFCSWTPFHGAGESTPNSPLPPSLAVF